jgi:hypothetical protein
MGGPATTSLRAALATRPAEATGRDEAAIRDELDQVLGRRAERAHGERGFDEQPASRRESLESGVERKRDFGKEI